MSRDEVVGADFLKCCFTACLIELFVAIKCAIHRHPFNFLLVGICDQLKTSLMSNHDLNKEKRSSHIRNVKKGFDQRIGGPLFLSCDRDSVVVKF